MLCKNQVPYDSIPQAVPSLLMHALLYITLSIVSLKWQLVRILHTTMSSVADGVAWTYNIAWAYNDSVQVYMYLLLFSFIVLWGVDKSTL